MHLLEEAVESFLRQDFAGESELVIVNDSDKVEYVFSHPRVKIYNVKNRFASIWEKLKFGIEQATYNHVYRLDDDDLLTPWALTNAYEDITLNPNHEIYRSNGHYFFADNVFRDVVDNVNTGNIYTKAYIERITQGMKDVHQGEDAIMTFHFNANIFKSVRKEKTMIYRWGMGTYHISGLGNVSSEEVQKRTDAIVEKISKTKNKSIETGVLTLNPHFKNEYYTQLPL